MVAHQGGDALDEGGLVDLVGELGDDDAGAAATQVLGVHLGADGDLALAGGVGGLDPLLAQDDAAGGEIGAGDQQHQVFHGHVVHPLVAVDHIDQGVAELAEVVRRDVGGHAHGDAGGAVQEQVGDAAGQDGRLFQAAVEIVHEIHRVLVNVHQHLFGDGGEPGLGIAHGRGAVAIHGAIVPLPVHQAVAHGKVLGQPHHGLIDGAIAVGVVLAEHLADDAGALFIGAVVAEPHIVHGVQDAALHRLEPVAGVGQGAGRDHAHGVIEIGVTHLAGDIELLYGSDLHHLTSGAIIAESGPAHKSAPGIVERI